MRGITGLCVAACIASANAADSTGDYVTVSESCGTFVRDYTRGGSLRYQSQAWVNGYVSAYNRLMSDTRDIRGGTDMESMMLWLNNYCREQPLKSLDDAMEVLTKELFPRRLRSSATR